jgi:putative transcriptional regulator
MIERDWLIKKRGSKSQAEIAASCGISQNFYCWIEKGKRHPSVNTAMKIAEVLNFDWTLFYTGLNERGISWRAK